MNVLDAVDVLERNSGIARGVILTYPQVAEAAILVAVQSVSPDERRKRADSECPEHPEAWATAHIADWPNVQAAVEAIRDYHTMLAVR